jgi:hypothetical protein
MNGRIERTDGEASEPPSSEKIKKAKAGELQVQMELADRLPLQVKRLHAADAPGDHHCCIVPIGTKIMSLDGGYAMH